MKIKMNREFYLQLIEISKRNKCNLLDYPLPTGLTEIVNEGIIFMQGCILLKKVNEEVDEKIITNDLKKVDKTGLECLYNHVHLVDYIEKCNISSYNDDIFYAGLSTVMGLIKKIMEIKVNNSKIIMAYNKSEKVDCVIRLHMVRTGEIWLVEDLDNYPDCVLTIES